MKLVEKKSTMAEEETMGEFYRALKEDKNKRRDEAVPARVEAILSLGDDGYRVTKLTDHQFRVTGIIQGSVQEVDLYPATNKMVNSKLRWSGRENDLAAWVRKFMKPLKVSA